MQDLEHTVWLFLQTYIMVYSTLWGVCFLLKTSIRDLRIRSTIRQIRRLDKELEDMFKNHADELPAEKVAEIKRRQQLIHEKWGKYFNKD